MLFMEATKPEGFALMQRPKNFGPTQISDTTQRAVQ